MIIHCVICKNEVKNWDHGGADAFHPIGGTSFIAHYGSGVFDPMDASYLELCICDPCLIVLREDDVVVHMDTYGHRVKEDRKK